nr:DUF4440 domain-containing protein [uncultured Pseudomonas sp.]
MDKYLQEVIDLHALIEAWFARGEGAVEAMVERFQPEFTMVAPSGQQVDLQAVEQLFEHKAGSQPGLVIELRELETLHQWAEGAMVRYREIHCVNGSDETVRVSTALLLQVEDQVKWRHLHETWA